MGENKGKAKGNWGRRGRVIVLIIKGQINCSRSGKVSWYKVVTDYKNHDNSEVNNTLNEDHMLLISVILWI